MVRCISCKDSYGDLHQSSPQLVRIASVYRRIICGRLWHKHRTGFIERGRSAPLSPVTFLIGVLLCATLACSLVAEGTVSDERRLVTEERPALVLLAPTNGNVYAAGTDVIFHAIATDAVGYHVSKSRSACPVKR